MCKNELSRHLHGLETPAQLRASESLKPRHRLCRSVMLTLLIAKLQQYRAHWSCVASNGSKHPNHISCLCPDSANVGQPSSWKPCREQQLRSDKHQFWQHTD